MKHAADCYSTSIDTVYGCNCPSALLYNPQPVNRARNTTHVRAVGWIIGYTGMSSISGICSMCDSLKKIVTIFRRLPFMKGPIFLISYGQLRDFQTDFGNPVTIL